LITKSFFFFKIKKEKKKKFSLSIIPFLLLRIFHSKFNYFVALNLHDRVILFPALKLFFMPNFYT